MGEVVDIRDFARASRPRPPREKGAPIEVVILPGVRVERHDVDIAPREPARQWPPEPEGS